MPRRTAAVLALLLLAGSIASAQSMPKKNTAKKSADSKPKPTVKKPTALKKPPVPKVGASASLDVTVDLNQIVHDITSTITGVKNREAWVKSLMEQTRSKTGGDCNVMVFNMQQNYDFNPPPHT